MQSITLDMFEKEVENSEVPVILDFWASWCSPCRALKPVMNQLIDESNGKFKVLGVDIDRNTDLTEKFRVSAIPTILIFKKGEEVERFVGVVKKEKLIEAVS